MSVCVVFDKYSGNYHPRVLEWGAFVGRKRVIKPRFWLLMTTALVLAFGCVYVSQGQYIARQAERIAQLQQEYTLKANENLQLERKIAFSKTDKYVERVAHEELGLLKENEIRFVSAGTAGESAGG